MRCAEDSLRLLVCLGLAAALAACGGPARRPASSTPSPSAAQPEPEPEPPPPDKEDIEGRFEAAVRNMRIGKKQEAIDEFQALTQDAPQFSGPYTNLGILYAERSQREPAIGALSQAVQLNPENKVALNLLAIQFLEAGNYVRAEQTWRQALSLDPGYAAAHLNLGMLYEQRLRQPQRAIEAYRAYQRTSDDDALEVDVWVAEIEAAMAAAPAPRPEPEAASSLETSQ